jgi:hypothetical protein
MRRACRVGWGLPVAAILASSCAGLPGTTLGTYAVYGSRTSNTCGDGIGAPNPWEFSVLLSQSASTLYWSWQDTSPLLSGPVDHSGHATLTGYEVANVDTRDGGEMGPCDMQRNDDLVLTLAPGAPPQSFQGMLSYTFASQEGADCSDQLTSHGGTYAELPCTVSYTLTASHQ